MLLPPPLVVLVLVPGIVAAPGTGGAASSPAPGPGTAPALVQGTGQGCSPPGRAAASPAEHHVMERIRQLRGIRFSAVVKGEGVEDTYNYTFSVCSSVLDGDPTAGLVQTQVGAGTGTPGKPTHTTIIGRTNSTQVIGGSDWIILIYGGGDHYSSYCGQERRRGMVMISCGPPGPAAFSAVLEEREKESECFYLFELDTDIVCPIKVATISVGSVLLILLFVLVAVYLMGGFIYQRMFVGAKGFDQFPHRGMWQELGNLTADGCDFVFRSTPTAPPPSYRGAAGSDPLDEGGEEDERDEHLLPM